MVLVSNRNNFFASIELFYHLMEHLSRRVGSALVRLGGTDIGRLQKAKYSILEVSLAGSTVSKWRQSKKTGTSLWCGERSLFPGVPGRSSSCSHQVHVNLQFCCILLDDVHAVHSG